MGAGDRAPDLLAHLRRARERDLVDVGGHEGRPGLPRTREHVHRSWRQLRRLDHLGEEQGGERRRLRGLQHGRVPGGEGRCELPCRHQHREVPGDHLSGYTDRLGVSAWERVVELVGPPRVIEEVRRGERQVDVARLLDRLAAVHRLEDGELAGALLESAGDPVEVLRPLAARQVAPPRCERVAGRGHGELNVLLAGLGHLGENLFRGRVDRGHVAPAPRLDELAPDEQAVPVLEPDDVLGFGGVRVRPRGRRGRAFLGRVEMAHPCLSHRNGSRLPTGCG